MFRHTRYASIIGIVALLISAFAQAAGYYAYIPNSADSTISVIDTETDTVVNTITVGFGPQGIETHPDGSRVYVGLNGNNGDGNAVVVIDAATQTVIDTITLSVEGGPEGMAFSPDQRTLYAATAGLHVLPPDGIPDTVTVIDTDTNTATGTIEVGDHPWDLVVSPDGSTLYVANAHSETLSIIDTATNTVTKTILLGDGLDTGEDYHTAIIEPKPDWSELWIAAMHIDKILVLDVASESVTRTIDMKGDICSTVPAGIGGPCEHSMGIAFHPSGDTAYVTLFATMGLSIIDTATYTERKRIEVGLRPKHLGVHPDGDRVYIGLQFANAVAVVDTATEELLYTIPVGAEPIPFGNFFVPKQPVLPGIGGSATNLSVSRATCQNGVTRQRITLRKPADNTWDCENAGFAASSGDAITMTVSGSVVATAGVGGVVTGADLTQAVRLTCTNQRDSSRVTTVLNGTDTWDCTAAGLVVEPGVTVNQTLRFVAE